MIAKYQCVVLYIVPTVLLPFNPLWACYCSSYIIYSCLSLRYIHHLWFTHGRVECLVPAGTSLTSHSLRLVLAKLRGLIPGYWSAGTSPGSPGSPTGQGEGGRRDRGGPNKNTTWHPHGKQPTYCQPASGAQHTAPLFTF